MPLEPFKNSAPLTMGVELELQLVNLSDFDLTAASPDMLHLLSRANFPGNVTPEVTESMIEINTGIHTNHNELLVQLQSIRDTLVKAGDKLNIGICGGGTHPFQRWYERKIFSKPRFQEVSSLYGYLIKQFTVFGQHIHIGCTSGDEALFLLHSLNRYIPHFIALSASSPYFQGIDTQFNSARLNSVFAFPLSGRAPFMLNWDDFENIYFAKMEDTGIVKSMKDFYWDIRPKPEYGTIELRVCDTPLTVEKAAALSAYLQALCLYLLDRNEQKPSEDDYLVYNYNRFQACRFGLDGNIIHPKTHETLSLRVDILSTLLKLGAYADLIDGAQGLDVIYKTLSEENDASYLRKQHTEKGSMEGVVELAIHRFRDSGISN